MSRNGNNGRLKSGVSYCCWRRSYWVRVERYGR
jgi:hypothetical protein